MFEMSLTPRTRRALRSGVPVAYELGRAAGAPAVSPSYARWIQRSLNTVLGLRLAVDGNIGPQTRSALRSFQARAGLRPDGIVGPLTEAALIRAGASAPTPAPAAAAAAALAYFKDEPRLQSVPLVPAAPLQIPKAWPSLRRRVGRIYGRLGGLMAAVAQQTGASLASVLAVWSVEGGGLEHVRNAAIIRFENHLLFRTWGKDNPQAYDAHFQHGGRSGVSGQAFQNHRFREDPASPFVELHGDQGREYRALELASRLAGADIALRCISIGGPQILVSNHRVIGYASAAAMYRAFQDDERWHVLGFFDFCRHQPAPRRGDLLAALREQRWPDFTRYYNGPGQVETYSALLTRSFAEASALPVHA